jgi:hypothetical protein
VTLALTGRFTVSLMFPEPLAVQVPPPAPTQVQLAPVIVAGSVSVTVAPVTASGPAFDATIVYVTDAPGTAVVCPSVFVIDRSERVPAPGTGGISSHMPRPCVAMRMTRVNVVPGEKAISKTGTRGRIEPSGFHEVPPSDE